LKRIYLAGPDVFLPNAAAVAAAKRELCAQYGFTGLSPMDNEIAVSPSKRETSQRISAANEALIRSCDLLIANITPFRGPSADVGTAYEMGFARGLGLPVLAYTNAGGTFLERTVSSLGNHVRLRPTDLPADQFDMFIEDFDGADNLMLTGAVEATGTSVIVSAADEAHRFTSLLGFEECLKRAQRVA
jgi:nucleoside 2-deoxyribosyltransferase